MKITDQYTIFEDEEKNEYRLFPKLNFVYPNYFSGLAILQF